MTSRRRYTDVLLTALAAIFLAKDAAGESAEMPPLQLEAKIPLGDVHGRIDHMAVDLARHRLFVAALGNDSLAVIDLASRRLDRLIGDLPKPQGVGFDPATDMLYVANAGDGSVRLFNDGELSPIGQIELGSDADNVRIDSKAGQVFVGYGDGALAIIDSPTHSKIAACHWRHIQRAFSSTEIQLGSSSTCRTLERSTSSIASRVGESRLGP